jgi:hypothetical protein
MVFCYNARLDWSNAAVRVPLGFCFGSSIVDQKNVFQSHPRVVSFPSWAIRSVAVAAAPQSVDLFELTRFPSGSARPTGYSPGV